MTIQTLTTADMSVAPGNLMVSLHAGHDVVTCSEAAAARGISLERELKTLILETSIGLVAAHLRGNRRVDLRKVKRSLRVKQARLAPPSELDRLGLSPGTVCAVLDPVWGLRHLISPDVLASGAVATNDGTRTGYFFFDPMLILSAATVMVAEIEST